MSLPKNLDRVMAAVGHVAGDPLITELTDPCRFVCDSCGVSLWGNANTLALVTEQARRAGLTMIRVCPACIEPLKAAFNRPGTKYTSDQEAVREMLRGWEQEHVSRN